MKFIILSFLSFQSFAKNTGIVEPRVKWSKNIINVCFGNDLNYPKIDRDNEAFNYKLIDHLLTNDMKETLELKKKELKDIISKEFKSKRTVISFQGFKDCRKNYKSDAVIFLYPYKLKRLEIIGFPDAEINGMSSVGQGGVATYFHINNQETFGYFHKSQYTPSIFISYREENNDENLSNAELFKYTALHEFSHLAGLMHEENREETPSQNEFLNLGVTAKYFQPFDHQSITNYQYLFWLLSKGTSYSLTNQLEINEFKELLKTKYKDKSLISYKKTSSNQAEVKVKIGLSKKDVLALKCLYKSNNRKKCRSVNF